MKPTRQHRRVLQLGQDTAGTLLSRVRYITEVKHPVKGWRAVQVQQRDERREDDDVVGKVTTRVLRSSLLGVH